VLYVITELAQYSLKDYLSLRREQNRPLSRVSIHNITKAIVLVMAGLHAKALVHLDMKPENMMMFNARLKLIDVDGCVKMGTSVSIRDSSISFSPCYCAPEWARFLIEEDDSLIEVRPGLDVWSIGMTLCELVTLDAVLKPMYASFLRSGHSHREAGFLFMEWLGGIKAPPLPRAVERFDPLFVSLIKDYILVCDEVERKQLAQCMSSAYIMEGDAEKAKSKKKEGGDAEKESANAAKEKEGGDAEKEGGNSVPMEAGETAPERLVRTRGQDVSTKPPIHKNTLWKLNTEGSLTDNAHWLKRDMWIAANGSFCYYSLRDDKRLVYLDQGKVARAEFKELPGTAKPFGFEVIIPAKDDKPAEQGKFAVDTQEEYDAWKNAITSVASLEMMPTTMRFNEGMIKDLRAFRLTVKNRRKAISDDEKSKFEPVFKSLLWKVKQDGDGKTESDWFERECWISQNGSLVYHSVKEDKNLVYYTNKDLQHATVNILPDGQLFRPNSFQLILAPHDGIEFAPGTFAGATKEAMDTWIAEFAKLQQTPE